MNISKLNSVIDGIQSFLVWFVIIIITVCIAVLLVFDVLAGTGTMLFLTGNKEWQSVVISLATTGLLFALMFIGYMLVTKTKNQVIAGVGKGVMGVSAILYVTDVVFDSLLADILRYGQVVNQTDWLQWAFRGVIGGISTVGDGLAIAMILGMPVLKVILQDALKDNSKSNTNTGLQSRNYFPPENAHGQTIERIKSQTPVNVKEQQRMQSGRQVYEPTANVQRIQPEEIPAFLRESMNRKK